MPYNSTSFERQLAKHRNEQAAKKAAASTPSISVDPHMVKSRVDAARGEIRPAYTLGAQAASDAGEQAPRRTPEPPQQVTPQQVKKPLYRRRWFTFLLFSVLSTAAVPVFFKGETENLMNVVDTVRAETGLDLMKIQTYKDMIERYIHDRAAQTADKKDPSGNQTEQTGTSSNPDDVIDSAQDRAREVSSQGSASSMKFIEQETQHLQQLSRDFDAQYGHQPQ